MNKPTVSIIIPVYNKQDYIYSCVNSVLLQEYKDFELLLIDDGSTDGSSTICDNLLSYDQRIKVYHKENGGAGSARKYGVEKAIGKWVMFVDADDTITHNGLSLLMTCAADNTDIICGAINRNGQLFAHKKDGLLNSKDYIKSLLMVETTDGPVAKLIRKKLFEGMIWNTPREITQNEDMLMLLELSTRMSNNVYLTSDIVCYNYHLRTGSATSSVMKYESWVLLFNEIESLITPLLQDSLLVRHAFCSYRLERIYKNLIQRGVTIKNNEYIKSLLTESQELGIIDKRTHIINSQFLQKIESAKSILWNCLFSVKRSLIRKTSF